MKFTRIWFVLSVMLCGCSVTLPVVSPSPAPVVVTNAPPVVVAPVTNSPAPVAVDTNDAFSIVSYSGEGGVVYQVAPMKQTCTITSWTLTALENSLTVAWSDSWPVAQIEGTMVWCWQDGSGVWQGQYVEWRGGASPYKFVGPFTDSYIHQYKAGDAWGMFFASLDHTQRSQTVKGVWQ
jgi:hypothetical protein